MMSARRRFAVSLSLLLAAAAPWPACATPPPPPRPCVPAGPAVSTDALRAIVAGGDNLYERDCAVADLAARGALGLPAVLDMVRSSDADIVYLGLKALARIGHRAHAALPALMDWIRTPSPALQENYAALYQAVGAIGPAARPAIPLLIAKTRDPAHCYFALDALGRLGKYDVQRVVPYLVSMLKKPAGEWLPLEAPLTLDALRDIGTPAQTALPAILASLEPTGETGDHMRIAAAERALAAIAPGSPALLERLLLEAIQHGSAPAAHALAYIAPLPSHFAPELAAALANKPGDVYLSMALDNARRLK